MRKKNIPQQSVARDVLSEKKREIEHLTTEAEAAVSLVTRTISNLELINQQIDDGVKELDAYAADIRETRKRMEDQRGHNAAIIANFSKLLSVDPEQAAEQ